MKRISLLLLVISMLLCLPLVAQATGETATVCQVVKADGTVAGSYSDFAQALAQAQNQSDRYVRLTRNVVSDAVVDGTVCVDLAGYTLQGITITGKFYGMDSATDGYIGSRCGVLTPASGVPERAHKTQVCQVGAVKRYLGVENGGGWSFHRFYMSVNKVSLKAGSLGVSVGYKAEFVGSSVLKAQLAQEEAYGYRLWVKEDNVITQAKSGADFAGHDALTLRIDKFMSPLNSADTNKINAELPVNASVFVKLADGTVIESDPVTYSFRQMVELADPNFDSFTEGQQAALNKMSVNYGLAMVGWDVPHIHHATGSIWTSYTEAKFLKILKDVGSSYYYKLPGGNYVLNEDVDLSQKQKDGKDMSLRIYPGETVRICLNGHTISSGNARVFRVYGNLDICDCHAGEHEGSIIGNRNVNPDNADDKDHGAVFYAFYNSVTNLYGGNLVATGTVNNGGVCVVAHDGDTEDATQVPAVFNIYGGTISGGNVTANGGLVWAIHESTVNMYGGRLYGGTAANKGGGICLGGGATANLYGGTIEDNTALIGGGVRLGEECTLKLAGSVVIRDNAATQKHENVSILMNTTLDFDGLEPGSQVGLSSDNYRVLGTNPQLSESIFSDDPDQQVRSHCGRMALVSKDMRSLSAVSGFQAGYGQCLINPEVIEGMPLSGYSTGATRRATAQDPEDWDDLYAQAVAVTDAQGETVLIITMDLIRCSDFFMDEILEAVHAATNVPKGNIFVAASHNHSSPETGMSSDPAVEAYLADLSNWIAKAAYQAMADRASATMQTGSFDAITAKGQRLNFVRHYSYKDANGVLKYFGDNFGTATYNSTTQHIWDADPTMHLVRFVRGGKDILLSNWRIHPHRTGGSDARKLSADVIGTLRYYMNQKLPDAHFMYIQGAAGDINSTSRLDKLNHGLSYTEYGKTLAQVVVDNLDCLKATDTGSVRVENYSYTATTDKPSEAEYLQAKAWKEQIQAKEAELAAAGKIMPMSDKAAMARELSAGTYNYQSYYELSSLVSRYNLRDTYQLPLNVFAIGNTLGFFTAPAELWDTVSVEMEADSPFDTTLCVGYCMDYHSYYPYYPGWDDVGAPYESYESECRRYITPTTVLDMLAYWKSALQRIYE